MPFAPFVPFVSCIQICAVCGVLSICVSFVPFVPAYFENVPANFVPAQKNVPLSISTRGVAPFLSRFGFLPRTRDINNTRGRTDEWEDRVVGYRTEFLSWVMLCAAHSLRF